MRNKEYTAKIKQGGIIVVSISGKSKRQVENDIQHYALMYSQDGELNIIRNYELI